MAWNLDGDRPIYIQLVEILQSKIIAGEYKPGERLPSVRDFAAEAGVNPNTMQRAFANLEQMGLIVTMRTNGRTVADNPGIISRKEKELADVCIEQFFTKMKEIGYEKKEALALAGAKVDGGDENE